MGINDKDGSYLSKFFMTKVYEVYGIIHHPLVNY